MKKADGKHPDHVTAHIITPDEKKRMLGASGSQATIETRIIAPEQAPKSDVQVENLSDKRVTGVAVIKVAMNVDCDHVWLIENGMQVSLEQAKKNPNAVYFDFERFDEEVELDDDTDTTGDIDEEMVREIQDEVEKEYQEPTAEEEQAILSQGGIIPMEEQDFGPQEIKPIPPPTLNVDDDPHTPAQKTGNDLVTSYIDKETKLERLSPDERRKLSWGGVFSAPGLQVYIQPAGVVRIDLDGKIKIQKAIKGETRILRITRLEPQINPIPSTNAAAKQYQYQTDPSGKTKQPTEPKNEEINLEGARSDEF